VIDPADVPETTVEWTAARRIIRSLHPPIDLFEDIADPADWPLLIAAEMKTNPRLMETIGALDLVPPHRRVSGPGASFLMAPFTHVSSDRPSRFSAGGYGMLYVADGIETALAETIYHHELFMARTGEPAGWTSQFRELILHISLHARDLRDEQLFAEALRPDDYGPSQVLGAALQAAGADGILYPSCRHRPGECVALFFPDLAADVRQGRHFDYHWNGERIDFIREAGAQRVFRID
jgi:hypothetical protein